MAITGRRRSKKRWRRRVMNPPPSPLRIGSELIRANNSDKYHGLRIRDLELGPTARIRAEQHVVYANHVIAGFRKLGAVEIARATGQFLLPCAPQPTDLE